MQLNKNKYQRKAPQTLSQYYLLLFRKLCIQHIDVEQVSPVVVINL